MLWMAISYLAMIISSFGIGIGVTQTLMYMCGQRNKRLSPIYYLITGFLALTVYAQIVSLFAAVTYEYAFLALGIAGVFMAIFRKTTSSILKDCIKDIRWYECFLFVVFLVFVMLLTSLHPKQYDNYLYQAQLLRYYEEYGVIKGMGNINTRLGFNNSIYALMALYSFKGIYGFSLHTVNSALCAFFGMYAIHGICRISKTKAYVSTGLRVAVLAYVFYNTETLNCIGTDLSAGIFGLLVLILFVEAIEQKEKDTFLYGLLAIYIFYVLTIKVSMAMLGILILYPMLLMLRKKEWTRLVIFALMCLLTIIPWLIRNVVISGWLIYPFPALDLFDVKWKIPYESAVYEMALVQGWARIQTSKVFETMELTFFRWFPQWFVTQPLRYRLLIYLNMVLAIYEAGRLMWGIIYKNKEVLEFLWIKATALIGIMYWLLSAPDIRFGWCYLVAFPIICIFSSKTWMKMSKFTIHKRQIGGVLFVCMALLVCGYVFQKANCAEVLKTSVVGRIQLPAFYIYQGDFSYLPVEEYQINGETFYYSPVSDQTGYYGFPGTTDKALLENLGYLGDAFEDGVYYKGGQTWLN